ncbi:MAG: FAD-dependent oxidoreductase, partial [Desulfobacterales bacterium]|nr:FAD-dependent oxidoreductase [Desulfobacterales bacterium]
MTSQLPEAAQVVIIGGGIVGCSTAYHLADYGFTDVVVLERKTLSSGTTFAAAGMLGQFRSNRQLSRLVSYAHEIYPKLEEITGMGTGYYKSGSVSLAQTRDRYIELQRAASTARSYGIEFNEVSLSEARDLVPGMSTEGLEGAFYIPGDGYTNPIDTTMAFAKGARNQGVRIFQDTLVTDLIHSGERVTGVKTDMGDIACEYLVICGGMWSRQLGQWLDISVPLHPVKHYHAVTLPIEGMPLHMPMVRDYDGWTYFKGEGGGLLFGGSEPVAQPWGRKGIPKDWENNVLPEDWEQFEIFVDCAFDRFPAMEEAEFRSMDVVPESFAVDSNFIMGEAPGWDNVFLGCGMNSTGIACAGGVGRELARHIVQGYPEYDFWPVSPTRFYSWQQNMNYVEDRSVEALGVNYHLHYPNRQKETGRKAMWSPLNDRYTKLGACFSQISGWERPDWFAPQGVEPKHVYDWKMPNWFEHQANEHRAARENLGMYDGSSMAKIMIQGKDALSFLQNACTNNLDVPKGKTVYTGILNERGCYESDVTITRLGRDEFFLVTATATGVHDMDLLRRRVPEGGLVTLTDVTHAWGMLAVMGPNSRQFLQGLTDDDLSDEAFPYQTAQYIDFGYARALAIRISYVGELGWELYVPTNFMIPLFDHFCEAGEKKGLVHIGLQAINSMRVEVGYRHWETDITPMETPLEAALAFAVDWNKGPFIGKDALLKQKEEGIRQRLV